MSTNNMPVHGIDDLTRDVAHLHKEVAILRRQILGLANYLNDRIGVVTHDGPVDLIHCHNCGAPVDVHPAPSGRLLLCPACGWSEFVDRQGHESCEVQPEQVPLVPPPRDWTD